MDEIELFLKTNAVGADRETLTPNQVSSEFVYVCPEYVKAVCAETTVPKNRTIIAGKYLISLSVIFDEYINSFDVYIYLNDKK